MNWDLFTPIARTVLYEGHVLYPYRPSALKNQHAFTFGTLHPPAINDTSRAGFSILIESEPPPCGELQVCFLQAGVERHFGAPLPGRMTQTSLDLQFSLDASLERLRPGLWKLTAGVANETPALTAPPSTDDRCMGSAQIRCALEHGSFVSIQDPAPELARENDQCHSQGLYPVLIGPPGERRYALAAPIILEDHPRVAPHSRGDFCDATEMDELLALRVLTLSDHEKAEIRAAGGEASRILERCETSPDLTSLHGGVAGDAPPEAPRMAPWESPPPESARCGAIELRVGDRVRLHPSGSRRQAELFDRVLDGRPARIQAIEQDLEGEIQLAVVAEDDPGGDLGDLRQTGHRFFYSPAEVEPL